MTFGLTDFTFFAVVDLLVRDNMKKFETRLLPTLREAGNSTVNGLIKDVPPEGYYSETSELKEYLNILRAMQNNEGANVTSDAIIKMRNIYDRSLFGLGPSKPNKYDFEKKALEWDPSMGYAALSPMHDTLSLAIKHVLDRDGFDGMEIQNIMRETENVDLGEHLVGLAVLVDRMYAKKNNGVYNPVACTLAAETTVGSRASVAFGGGQSMPELSPEVEEMGLKIIKGYNQLFSEYPEGKGLNITDKPKEIRKLAKAVAAEQVLGRCVMVAIDEHVDPPMYYHWGVTLDKDKDTGYPFHTVAVDFLDDHIVTSEKYREQVFDNLHKKRKNRA